jgi:hypothetical protein
MQQQLVILLVKGVIFATVIFEVLTSIGCLVFWKSWCDGIESSGIF